MKSALYSGRVMHQRHTPFEHGFERRLYMTWLDLSELDRVFERRLLWSAKRLAWSRFRREDHLGDPAEPLDESVRQLVRTRLGLTPGERELGPVRLLTSLRVAGFRMNPVSFFFCYAPDGEHLEAVVAEVTNTPWDERHVYVLDMAEAREEGADLQLSHPKQFHVSPFMPMDQIYTWSIGRPADRLRLRIESRDPSGQLAFTAGLSMSRVEIGWRSLAAALVCSPLMPLRVASGIYWQALLLKLRGARFHSHPGEVADRRVMTS